MRYGTPVLIRRTNELPPPRAERRLRRAGGVHAPAQLPLRPRQRRRAVRPEAAAVLLPRPVLRLLPQPAARGMGLHQPARRRRPGVAGLPLVPRPPRRSHGGEHLQGAGRAGDHLQRVRHGEREHGLPPAELPELRHPARVRGQADRSHDGPDRLRHVQHRRPARQRVPGERQGAAVPPGAEAPLPLPAARRRAVALLRVLPHEPGEPEPEDPVLGHLERRQPAAAADRGHEHPRRRGRALRHHRRLQQDRPALRQPAGHPPREPSGADRRARPDRQDPARRPGRSAARVPARRQPAGRPQLRPGAGVVPARAGERRTTPCSRRSPCRTSAR